MNLAGVLFAGKYRLEKLIGEGAFGKIYLGIFYIFSLYLAKSTDLTCDVAVKLVLFLLD